MTRKLRPTLVTEPDGSTHLLPAVDEPRLDSELAALRWRWLHEKAVRWARCPRCRAMPCHACTDRTGTRKPHRARLRLVKDCHS